MSQIFNNSLSQLNQLLSEGKLRTHSKTELFSKAYDNSGVINESSKLPIKFETDKTLIQYDKNFILENFGPNEYEFPNISIGTHPDFIDINHSNYIMHHCVAMFVDIKGSTKLVDKYPIQQVRLIKDTLLSLVIMVVNQFGGHIQRLQGDGVFITFARRNRDPRNSIINALNAGTLLTQFVSTDLAEIFKSHDITPLRVRIGIDYGDDENVLWSYYGIAGCDELTTTSLHTDMAAKLQGKAADNSILIGNNIVKELDLTREVVSNYYTSEGREEVYQITPTLTYKFYIFEWKSYLIKHPNFKLLTSDNKVKYEKKTITIKCEYTFEGVTTQYFPNSKGIPKGAEIYFTLYDNNQPYIKKNFEEIRWTIYNTGTEAKNDNHVQEEVSEEAKNQNTCHATAKYLGLHKIQCKLIRYSENINFDFPVIVV